MNLRPPNLRATQCLYPDCTSAASPNHSFVLRATGFSLMLRRVSGLCSWRKAFALMGVRGIDEHQIPPRADNATICLNNLRV